MYTEWKKLGPLNGLLIGALNVDGDLFIVNAAVEDFDGGF